MEKSFDREWLLRLYIHFRLHEILENSFSKKCNILVSVCRLILYNLVTDIDLSIGKELSIDILENNFWMISSYFVPTVVKALIIYRMIRKWGYIWKINNSRNNVGREVKIDIHARNDMGLYCNKKIKNNNN